MPFFKLADWNECIVLEAMVYNHPIKEYQNYD